MIHITFVFRIIYGIVLHDVMGNGASSYGRRFVFAMLRICDDAIMGNQFSRTLNTENYTQSFGRCMVWVFFITNASVAIKTASTYVAKIHFPDKSQALVSFERSNSARKK